jgi:hypothetical protein
MISLKRDEDLYSSLISGHRKDDNEYGSVILASDAKQALLLRMDQMNNTKREYLEKLKLDIEYNNTLKCQIEMERLNLNKICENINLLKLNSNGILLTNKCLDQNYSEQSRKSQKITSLSKDFKDEVVRMNGLIYLQNNRVNCVSNTINKHIVEIQKCKDQVKEKNYVFENNTKLKKLEIIEVINDVEKYKKIKKNKENYFFKVILGLDLIKR